MRILIANDDGIFSPGIQTLAEIAAAFGDVRIVAPDVEQSSMGHAITHSRPLTYRRTKVGDFEAYRVNGTPADCVALGMHHWSKVDVVLSGINLGYNLGNSMWHSGTLAAAKQAALFGCRGIALSAMPYETPADYVHIRPAARAVLDQLFRDPDPPRLVNVNFPEQPRGIVWTRQSVRQYDGKVFPVKDPMGRALSWISVVPLEGVDEGTDRWAISQSLISLTPLRLDLTDQTALDKEIARPQPTLTISP